MDITETLAPNSDQLDAVDLLGGPRTFTVSGVRKGNAEQPVQVDLAEFPRTWRPGKSMRRVLAACWGADASQWVGRRVTLYCDTEVAFGGEKVGGTRISALSHIDKAMTVPLIVKRGKSASVRIEPLREATPPADTRTPAEKAVAWFASQGATQAELEAHVGKPVADWTGDDLDGLRGYVPEAAR